MMLAALMSQPLGKQRFMYSGHSRVGYGFNSYRLRVNKLELELEPDIAASAGRASAPTALLKSAWDVSGSIR